MSSSSPPLGASPVPTSPPAASPPPAAPPTPSNSTAPPPATPPTPSNSTAPPPATPPTPSNPTAPPPQPTAPPPGPAPSSPPPAASPPPSPAASSPPPPSAPSASPPPSPATPSASPPPSPATPSLSPPPSPATPSISSPPPPSPSGNSPPSKTSPPPPPPPPSSNSVSTPLVVGVAVGAVILLALLGLVCFCCRRKKRRAQPPLNYYGDDNHGGRPQNWQHIAPPPADHAVKIPPQPSPPPPFASRPPYPASQFPFPPPPPPPPVISSSGGSSSNYSGSESLPPPPSPGLYLGFSKSSFTFEELAMATDGFSDANLLGQGGFGYVHKGILLNGKEVAIKQLKSGSLQGEREFHAEVEIISRVHHRHLVSLVGYCISGGQRLLVYEYVPNKTLDFHLHGKDQPTMGWATRLKIALGSAKGLAYLHEDCHPKIIHRDIKAANILLDFKFEAKVADFGLAKFASDNNTHISTRVMGTFGYLAPEYASTGKLTDKSDVFSFGVMLLELITGRRPVNSTQGYMDDSLVDWARPLLTRAIDDGNYDALIDPRLEKNYSLNEVSHMVACAAACVRHSARRRPRMSQIVRALEGEMSLEDLNEGIRPGHSTHHGSYGSTDYDSSQYNEDMKRFRKMALASQDHTSSEYSAPTSEYGLHPSASSSEGQQTRDMEMGKIEETEPKLQQQPVKLD